MSIYDNETSKIYPDLYLVAPKEPQAYQLKKLTVIEAYLLDEIEICERLEKNKSIQYNDKNRERKSNNISSYCWRGFYCCICKWQWPACDIMLSETSLMFTVKKEKHDAINLFAQSKLDSIANIIQRTMQDGDI